MGAKVCLLYVSFAINVNDLSEENHERNLLTGKQTVREEMVAKTEFEVDKTSFAFTKRAI